MLRIRGSGRLEYTFGGKIDPARAIRVVMFITIAVAGGLHLLATL